MECEMCGNAAASSSATVEGVRMRVCASCARSGTAVTPIVTSSGKAAAKLAQEARARERAREEDLQSVHPDIAKLLRAHRTKTGLTQEEFARKLNLRASVYQHYETGASVPDIGTARRIEHELRVPLVVKIAFKGDAITSHHAAPVTLGDLLRTKKKP